MKITHLFFILLLSLSFAGCSTQNNEPIKSPVTPTQTASGLTQTQVSTGSIATAS